MSVTTVGHDDPANALEEPSRPDRRPTILQTIALALACLFLGGAAVTVWDNRDTTPDPGAADIGFLDDMLAHHQQAIDMSLEYLSRGSNSLMRHMAYEVLYTQIGEVGVMNQQLAEWDEVGDDVAMAWMGMSHPEDAQPGMASPEEMEQLREGPKRDLDELFSRLMIEHHAGGAHMADAAVDLAETEYVRSMAAAMAQVQRDEINELNVAREQLGLSAVSP
jgi:uncharacterized protein (DUF305 family)